MQKTSSILLLLLITMCSGSALANSASWSYAENGGTPGPVQSEHLVLEKEEVVFADGVVRATFWVKNTHSEDVTTQMGFPSSMKEKIDNGGIDHPLDPVAGKIVVTQDGEPLESALTTQQRSEYQRVIAWSMTFPARKTTRLVVEHPLFYDSIQYEVTGLQADIRFDYITHTGAYWAKPIGEATFKFCDEKIMGLIGKFKGKTSIWSEDLGTRYDVRWKANPKPTRVTKKCVIWTRKKFRPKRGKDDLSIEIDIVDTADTIPSRERMYDRWCGRYRWADWDYVASTPYYLGKDDVPKDGYSEEFAHLARRFGVEQTKLDSKRLARIEAVAFKIIQNTRPDFESEDEEPGRVNYPSRAKLSKLKRLEFQLTLYRYLRNYHFARHGRRFESAQLAQCFANVQVVDAPMSSVGRANVKFLASREKALRAEFKKLERKALSAKVSRDVMFSALSHAMRVDEGYHTGASEELSFDTVNIVASRNAALGLPAPASSSPLVAQRAYVLLHDHFMYVTVQVHNPGEGKYDAVMTTGCRGRGDCQLFSPYERDMYGQAESMSGSSARIFVDGRPVDASFDERTYKWPVSFATDQTRTIVFELPINPGWRSRSDHHMSWAMDADLSTYSNDALPTLELEVHDNVLFSDRREPEYAHEVTCSVAGAVSKRHKTSTIWTMTGAKTGPIGLDYKLTRAESGTPKK